MVVIVSTWVEAGKHGLFVDAKPARQSPYVGDFVVGQSDRWNREGKLSFRMHRDVFVYVGF